MCPLQWIFINFRSIIFTNFSSHILPISTIDIFFDVSVFYFLLSAALLKLEKMPLTDSQKWKGGNMNKYKYQFQVEVEMFAVLNAATTSWIIGDIESIFHKYFACHVMPSRLAVHIV